MDVHGCSDFRIRIRPPEAASPDLHRITRFRSLGSERIRRFTSRLTRTRVRTPPAATRRRRAPRPSWSRLVAQRRHIRPLFIRYLIVADLSHRLCSIKSLSTTLLCKWKGQMALNSHYFSWSSSCFKKAVKFLCFIFQVENLLFPLANT